MHPTATVVNQLVAADLEHATERVALRLLAAASDGHARLTWDDYLALCGVETEGAGRRHLSRLKAAGIIQYTTMPHVLVYFVAFHDPWTDHPRSVHGSLGDGHAPPTDHEDGSHDPPTDRTRAAHGSLANEQNGNDPWADHDAPPADHPRAVDGSPPTRDGCLFVNTSFPEQLEQTNNHGPPNQNESISEGEQAQTVSLLVDREVGIAMSKAKAIAARFRFVDVRDQVAAWLPRFESGEAGTGLLITAIQDHYAAPEISDAFRDTALYRRHRTADEIAADETAEREQREFEEASRGPNKCKLAPVPEADFVEDPAWANLIAEFENGNRAAFERLRYTGVLEVVDSEESLLYLVGTTRPADLDWLRNRLLHQVARTLESMAKRRVTVEFVSVEAEAVT